MSQTTMERPQGRAYDAANARDSRRRDQPSPVHLPRPRRPGPGTVLRRIFLGYPLLTSQLKHERLGRPAALAIFASDMLSSVAYATEEMLRAMLPAIGLLAFSYVLPLSVVIAVLLFVLLFSYRQTIKAYPTAGGAYMVTRDNMGFLPAQIAGFALLSDYILTVAVSTAAGVLATTSYFPALHSYKVPLALLFVAVILWGNLRGVRESGRLFAFPAYFFLAITGLMIVVGIAKLLTGTLQVPSSESYAQGADHASLGASAGLSVVVLLKAFASGGAAATGIEAVSNGVSAFRPPEWKNARQTLAIIVSLVASLFLGISLLASVIRPLPDPEEKASVLAMIGMAVFGSSSVGRFLFGLLQLATTLILIFAANTSFAGFPRLASFQATDMFLPRLFTRRGYRLNYSIGILVLGAVASLILIIFQASVHRLIPLYAVGVFTSITFSQAGMSIHHLRLREPGWRVGLFVNGIGAVMTAVVVIVVAAVKFVHGAWVVIVLAPLGVAWMYRVNKHYREEIEVSKAEPEDFRHAPTISQHHAIVLAEAIDAKLLRALEFALTIGPSSITCLHVASNEETKEDFEREWALNGPEVDVVCLAGARSEVQAAAEFVKQMASEPNTFVTVVVPAPFKPSPMRRLGKGPLGYRLSRALRRLDNVNVCVVRELPGAIPETSYTGSEFRFRISPRPAYRAVIAVDRVDKSLAKSLAYATALRPFEVECVHAAVEPKAAVDLAEDWVGAGIDKPLEIVGCEDRDIGRAFYNYLSAKAWNPRYAVLLILPRRDFPRRWHFLLHDRTRRRIAQAVAPLRNVYVVSVPYYFDRNGARVLEGDGNTSEQGRSYAAAVQRHTKRAVVSVVGGSVVALGVVLLVTPGPGWVVIAMGLGILATEYVWARRLLEKAKEQAAKGARAVGSAMGLKNSRSSDAEKSEQL